MSRHVGAVSARARSRFALRTPGLGSDAFGHGSFVSDLRVSAEFCQSPLLRSKGRPLWTPESRDRPSGRKREEMATSKKDASAASKQLTNPKSTKPQKSVAASDLSQAKGKGKK
jgi:hypothetical protein